MGTRSRKKCQFITKHSLSFVPVDMARLKGEPGRTRHEHKDEQLKGLEDQFYLMLEDCSEDFKFEMERVISSYMTRVLRIAYLQGIKDFLELFIVLKEDTRNILQKYVDV